MWEYVDKQKSRQFSLCPRNGNVKRPHLEWPKLNSFSIICSCFLFILRYLLILVAIFPGSLSAIAHCRDCSIFRLTTVCIVQCNNSSKIPSQLPLDQHPRFLKTAKRFEISNLYTMTNIKKTKHNH